MVKMPYTLREGTKTLSILLCKGQLSYSHHSSPLRQHILDYKVGPSDYDKNNLR